MKTLFSFFILFFTINNFAQEIKIVNEQNIPIENSVIINTTNQEHYFTNTYGKAVIKYTNGDKLSISAIGYNTKIILNFEEIVVLSKSKSILLDEVVITTENIRKSQIINQIDITNRPLNNSQEILNIIPGLFIGQHAGGGKAEQLFVRGFDIDHGTDFQIDVDGMPVNMVSHAHGQGYADLHFLMPELIQKVEFNKGGYSAEKGNFATSGWASFKTKDILENSFIKQEIGMFDTYRTALGMNINKKGIIAGEYQFSNSYFDSPQNFNRINVFGKYQFDLSKNTKLTLSTSYFESKWNHSGQIPDRAVNIGLIGFFGAIDDTEGGKTSRFNFNSQLQTQFNSQTSWSNQFFFVNYNFELFSNFTFFLDDPMNGDQIKQHEKRNILGYNSVFQKKHTLFNYDSNLKIGFQNRFDLIKDNELSHTLNRKDVINPIQFGNVNEINTALFIEEQFKVNSKFSIDFGLRFDYFSHKYEDLIALNTNTSNASILSPKLNLYYQINSNFKMYLTNGKSFHSNDTRVVVPENGRKILPASYGSDLGFYWKPFKNIVINTALWYIWLEDELVYVGDAGVVEPSGKTMRKGIDFLVRYQINKNWFADIDLNLVNPRALGVAKGENRIPLAPVFTSVGGFGYKNSKGFSATIRSRYMANRPANEDNSIVAKGYFLSDFNTSYTYKNWDFGLQVFNIFNTKWKETQFATESQLQGEANSVEEIHFTPGTPFNLKFITIFKF
ncbi:TonB-dependent receptor [Flavobacterium sp.]|jgi:hypothetical protein|uniref:TonB-dependent receptor n=1 Tax=Flavobacterium sp. TaxID=239 RepID=UPI0037C05E5A